MPGVRRRPAKVTSSGMLGPGLSCLAWGGEFAVVCWSIGDRRSHGVGA